MQWDEQAVKTTQEKFEEVFKEMYDEEFLDCIFEEFKSLITYDNFIEAIKPKDVME